MRRSDADEALGLGFDHRAEVIAIQGALLLKLTRMAFRSSSDGVWCSGRPRRDLQVWRRA